MTPVRVNERRSSYGYISGGGNQLVQAAQPNRERKWIFRRALLAIAHAANSKKSAHCCLIAIGDPAAYSGGMEALAKEFGVTKADISKCCVDWCEFFGIRPSRHMRSADSRASFRLHNYRPRKQHDKH